MALWVVFDSVKSFINGNTSSYTQSAQSDYLRKTALAALVILGASGLYGGYNWYVAYRERSAHFALSNGIIQYEKAMASTTGADWAFVDATFKAAYDMHSRALLAPYFLVFRAHALQEQGMMPEAISLMDTAVAHVAKKSPLYFFVALRRALMKIDSEDQAVHDAGVLELERLSYDATNMNRDAALSYLGAYYASVENSEKSEQAYKTLVDLGWHNGAMPSPWYQDAVAQLGGK